MISSRELTVNLKPGATAGHICAMLSDLPPGMELVDIFIKRNDPFGRVAATLRFHDQEKP